MSESAEKIAILKPGQGIIDGRGRKYDLKIGSDGLVYLEKTNDEVIEEIKVLEWLASKSDFEHFMIPEYSVIAETAKTATILSRFYPPNLGHKALNEGSEPIVHSNFEDYLDKIILAALEIISIEKDFVLPMDYLYIEKNYHQRATNWANIVLQKHADLKSLLDKLLEYSKMTLSLPKAFSHGNLWQDHFSFDEVTKKLVIFDFGTASFERPEYYDLVFLIHRLYTGMLQPEIAMRLWYKLIDHIGLKDQDDLTI